MICLLLWCIDLNSISDYKQHTIFCSFKILAYLRELLILITTEQWKTDEKLLLRIQHILSNCSYLLSKITFSPPSATATVCPIPMELISDMWYANQSLIKVLFLLDLFPETIHLFISSSNTPNVTNSCSLHPPPSAEICKLTPILLMFFLSFSFSLACYLHHNNHHHHHHHHHHLLLLLHFLIVFWFLFEFSSSESFQWIVSPYIQTYVYYYHISLNNWEICYHE